MCCSENAKLEKIKSVEEMSPGASTDKKKQCHKFYVSSLDTFFMMGIWDLSCPQRSRKANENIFLLKRAVIFLNSPSLA